MFGRDVTRSPLQRRVALGLGRTYQITETFGTLTVRENLALAVLGLRRRQMLSLRAWSSVADCAARVESLALRFGLRRHCDHLVSELSHGEVRQLDIALAMAQNPRLLLLDEPGAGLSTGERMEIREVLKALPENITFIIIEHDMDMLRDVAEWTTVLHSGQVIAEGPHDVVADNEEVRAVYLGASLE
jgi:branched-chain amino acid transport system ATP-binding protein